MELPSPAQSPSRSFRSPYRRRRVVWFVLFFTVAGLFFLAPDSFWEVSHGHELAAAGKEWIKPIIGGGGGGQQTYTRDEELKDLLHMVASSELTIPKTADPSNPLPKDTYKADLEGAAWLQEAQADPPIIVFSKTYCPYSKSAKALFQQLDPSPPPKYVEVDLRSDADAIKAVLQRLTGHGTFPNIFIEGQSIGGFDALQRMYDNGELVPSLANAGVSTQHDAKDSSSN